MILSNVNMLRILLLDVCIIILVYRQIFGVEIYKKNVYIIPILGFMQTFRI